MAGALPENASISPGRAEVAPPQCSCAPVVWVDGPQVRVFGSFTGAGSRAQGLSAVSLESIVPYGLSMSGRVTAELP